MSLFSRYPLEKLDQEQEDDADDGVESAEDEEEEDDSMGEEEEDSGRESWVLSRILMFFNIHR